MKNYLLVKKIIISGGRDFDNYELFESALIAFMGTREASEIEIIHGDCPTGADQLANRFAKEYWVRLKKFPVTKDEWNKFGKAAGQMRNQRMINHAGKDAEMLAFWDGISKGTGGAIEKAKKKGIKVKIVNYIPKQTK